MNRTPADADVLLVDDSTTDAELLSHAIEQLDPDLRCIWIKDGQEALDWLLGTGAVAERQPHVPLLIVLDVEMPRMTGLQVLERLKQDPAVSRIPVVVMSSQDDPKGIERSYALGASRYVVKPLLLEQYLVAVQEIMLCLVREHLTRLT